MDAQRSRRTRDKARKSWYAYYRQVRFARWFGFIETDDKADWSLLYRSTPARNQPEPWTNLALTATVDAWSQADLFQTNAPSVH